MASECQSACLAQAARAPRCPANQSYTSEPCLLKFVAMIMAWRLLRLGEQSPSCSCLPHLAATDGLATKSTACRSKSGSEHSEFKNHHMAME